MPWKLYLINFSFLFPLISYYYFFFDSWFLQGFKRFTHYHQLINCTSTKGTREVMAPSPVSAYREPHLGHRNEIRSWEQNWEVLFHCSVKLVGNLFFTKETFAYPDRFNSLIGQPGNLVLWETLTSRCIIVLIIIRFLRKYKIKFSRTFNCFF